MLKMHRKTRKYILAYNKVENYMCDLLRQISEKTPRSILISEYLAQTKTNWFVSSLGAPQLPSELDK